MTSAARRDLWRRFARNRGAVAGLVVLGLVVLAAALADLLYGDGPLRMVARPLQWPGTNPAFPLGTDRLGRDIAAGIFHGARISLLVGIMAAAFALAVGVVIGALAGFYRGIVDSLLMRLADLVQTIPPFLLALVLLAILRPSVANVVFAIGVSSWPPVARIVRAEFLSLREREFVQAGIAAGMGDLRLILTQILPNALAPVIVFSSLLVATAILTESALAFLGFTDPNVMSWGTIIGIGRNEIRTAWYIAAIPGMAILLTVLALNLVGEGLNDALNPRLRDR
ncbi:ABC transporter permease [Falsiroseomonas oryzae]|uniref:ABC transporter permease n=1 Tax=Falsiroseomonas oryzae TaxID=2766473 RepID=UPI0022EA8119|nr:ABC transporter permease [Roseomonas sp. MO-31]